ncbi:putative ribonuclease ZC3H12B [Amphibalanus amphitrite]|uniref:Putative ribonuclease ZC3H12B n=1 Tax=Amphibalanus amphitrite TaxID=1232801 RepID=A0A6A4VW48_AMPAM|nr:putative ribonuclease ZC3H12B [Amphibalanus amphitrite]
MIAMSQEGCRRLVPLARCYQPVSPAAPGPARDGRRLVMSSRLPAQSALDEPPRKLKLEAEDSSYDSDSEAAPAPEHEDVSRTVSDTLGAEFAEYVTAGASETADYANKVEFACKLGYTEEHVQRALRKLGAHPGNNDFLEELIRVGKDGKGAVADVEELDERTARLRISRESREEPSNLRHIVLDGSNVAMSHGNKERFSCRGIRLAVEYFRARGHQGITVFVPMWRKEAPRPDTPITDQDVLLELEREGILVFTPSRVVDGKRITCYDDRQRSTKDGVVVSNDNYRDLHKEKQFKKIIEERILMYSFANDRFMPPDDPLGRNGPTLDNFLRKSPRPSESLCPYGKKCTYGNKCKYYHPERGNQPQKSVTEKLAEHAQRSLQGRRGLGDGLSGGGRSVRDKTLSLPPSEARQPGGQPRKQPVSRTRSLVPGSVPADSRPAPPDDTHLRASAKSRSMENQRAHKPLVRQLTLNPTYDPRLAQREQYVRELEAQLGRQQMMANRNLLSPHWDGGHSHGGQHPQHASVTRIASAPDSCRQLGMAPPPPHEYTMQRLSSTSDPQLNVNAPGSGWPSVAASRAPAFNPFQPNPLTASLSTPPLGGAGSQSPGGAAVAPAAAAPFGVLGFGAGTGYNPDPVGTQPSSPRQSKDELRRNIYWHLCALFPEEKVRVAMNLMPDETDAAKICAEIVQPK